MSSIMRRQIISMHISKGALENLHDFLPRHGSCCLKPKLSEMQTPGRDPAINPRYYYLINIAKIQVGDC